MLETGISIIEWPSLPYCTMSAFGGDAWQRKAMSHKSSFIIIDNGFCLSTGSVAWWIWASALRLNPKLYYMDYFVWIRYFIGISYLLLSFAFNCYLFVISCYCYVDKVVLDWWVNLLDGEITSFNLTYEGLNISHWLTGPKPHIHQTPLLPKIISFL